MPTPYSGRETTRSSRYTCIVTFAGYIYFVKNIKKCQCILRDISYVTVIRVTPVWNQQYKLSMRYDNLHKKLILKQKKVDSDCGNKILYFLFTFLNSIGYHFMT